MMGRTSSALEGRKPEALSSRSQPDPTTAWARATEAPDRIAIIEDDGTEHTAGAVLAACNQVVHGLRALGLGKGDTVAVVMPNSAAVLEVALAAGQAGMYITPVNHHLTASEIGFILRD